MDYISEMKKMQITFNLINEQTALKILQNEYSYYQLIEYAQLFDKYFRTEKKGQFVKLEFAQIYYLALIDEQLRHLIIQQCLELEKILKLQLINFFNEKDELSSRILHEYIKKDSDYLFETYKESRYEIFHEKYPNCPINKLRLEEFLDIIQFGTLERFWIFCCENCNLFTPEKICMFKECFLSTRYLRNASAHNNSILSQLRVRIETAQQLSAPTMVQNYLHAFGIRQKTLKTNMSKKIVKDICNFMFLCKEIESKKVMQKNCELWRDFLNHTYTNYAEVFIQNEIFKSVFTFTQNVNILFLDEIQKKD